MKQKKEFKYHLKSDVFRDLLNLDQKIRFLLDGDLVGFDSIPSNSILPAFYRVYSHLIWCKLFKSWFKKVCF